LKAPIDTMRHLFSGHAISRKSLDRNLLNAHKKVEETVERKPEKAVMNWTALIICHLGFMCYLSSRERQFDKIYTIW
jgi:hypothetical protein